MAELILEPYAALLHWRLPAGREDYPWDRILAEFLGSLAGCCEVEGESVIGHIKGLATFPGGGYLRANVVSPSHPVDVAGAAPEDCSGLTFTLNVLVYGLSYDAVSDCVEQTASQAAGQWGGSVSVEPLHGQAHEPHHHH